MGARQDELSKPHTVAGTLLRGEEWSAKSDRWIAKACRVDHKTVAAMRVPGGEIPTSRLGQDGKVYPKRTAAQPAPRASPPREEPPEEEAEPAAQPRRSASGQPVPVSDPPTALWTTIETRRRMRFGSGGSGGSGAGN